MLSREVYNMQARLCQALGHASRLEIIYILRDGVQPVKSLAQITGLKLTALSRHLAVLRQQGIIAAQHQGQENVYHLLTPKIVLLCDLMRQLLAEQLSRQSEIADKMIGE